MFTAVSAANSNAFRYAQNLNKHSTNGVANDPPSSETKYMNPEQVFIEAFGLGEITSQDLENLRMGKKGLATLLAKFTNHGKWISEAQLLIFADTFKKEIDSAGFSRDMRNILAKTKQKSFGDEINYNVEDLATKMCLARPTGLGNNFSFAALREKVDRLFNNAPQAISFPKWYGAAGTAD